MFFVPFLTIGVLLLPYPVYIRFVVFCLESVTLTGHFWPDPYVCHDRYSGLLMNSFVLKYSVLIYFCNIMIIVENTDFTKYLYQVQNISICIDLRNDHLKNICMGTFNKFLIQFVGAESAFKVAGGVAQGDI